MKVLVVGASGMLGNTMLKVLSEKEEWMVFGTVRSRSISRFFSPRISKNLIFGCDVENHDSLVDALNKVQPDVVINCVGLIKQLADANDPLVALPINAILPHRLAKLCDLAGARLIHMSTDCVFTGEKGNYSEDDVPDATDLYGLSKLLGEVHYPHTVTLRTSIIGHELQSMHGLIEWFLSQQEVCSGYRRAIFSGLPTVVLAQIVRDVVIPQSELSGLYHVASQPIDKYNLLKLVAGEYGKIIAIEPDDQVVINRSLNATRFQDTTGYISPDWKSLISIMHSYHTGQQQNV